MIDKRLADRLAAELKLEVGRCENCGGPPHECHEILRGGLRWRARGVRCASLVLCRPCHNRMDGMAWERQLAILWRSRPEDMDLLEFWSLADRRKPSVEELLAAVTEDTL